MSEVRERVARALPTDAGDPDLLLAPMLDLLGVLPLTDAFRDLDPRHRRQRTDDAIKQVLLAASIPQPLCLIIEDLHWIDAATQEVLDRVVTSMAAVRVLLVVNYRPEYEHPWSSKTYYSQIRLDALAAESTRELLDALLGEDPTLEPLKQRLVRRGNPFFLEESVRTLAETGVIVGEGGSYRLGKPMVAIQVPSTVQAVLAARIDRLSVRDKRLLQSAAVIGKDVPFVLLQAIGDASPEELRTSLRRLQAAEFLYETDVFHEVEYTFKHALTHDVAYGSLLHEQRRLLHARIVDAIERLYGGRLSEQVEGMAHHAVKGEVWDKAVAYCRQAGAKAMTRSAYSEAAARFEQALDALRNLPESRSRTEQAIELHFDASRTLLVSGGMAKSMDHARQAEVLATSLGDERRRGRALVFLMHRAWNMGDSNRALELGQEAVAIGVGLRDASLEMSANQRLGAIELTRGDYRQAADRLRRVTEQLQDVGRHERVEINLTSVNSRDRLVWCLTQLGEFTDAMERAEEAIRIALELDHPSSLVFAHRSVGLVSLRRGDLTQAIAPLERAVELCRVIPAPLLFDIGAAHLGYAYTLSGRLQEGMALMEEALAEPAVTGSANHPLFLAHLAEAHLLAGRRDDAIAVARRALDLAQLQKERGNEAWIQRVFGEISAQADPDLESAEAHYGSALARAAELGMRPVAAHCHLGLGKLYRRSGKREQAREHLTTASKMFREMGMRFWLEQAEAETKELE